MRVPLLLFLVTVVVLADATPKTTEEPQAQAGDKVNEDVNKGTAIPDGTPTQGAPINAEHEGDTDVSQKPPANRDDNNIGDIGDDALWDEEDLSDYDDEDTIELTNSDVDDDAQIIEAVNEEHIKDLIDTYDNMEDLVEDDDIVTGDVNDADEEVEPEVTDANNIIKDVTDNNVASPIGTDEVTTKEVQQPVMSQQSVGGKSVEASQGELHRSQTQRTDGQPEKRPNIVILLADDVGMGDIGCFGNDTMKTPFIDQLAQDGVKMTHHLAAASVCTPSRAALLTGRYPVRSGMAPSNIVRVNIFVASTGGLPPSEITIAELAKEQGYATGYIGKWHMGVHCGDEDFCHHPNTQGFDHFYGLPMTNLKDFGPEGCTVTKSRIPNMDYYLVMAAIVGVSTAIIFRKLLGTVLAVLLLLLSLLVPALTYWIYTNMTIINAVLMRNLEVVEQPLDLDNRLAGRMAAEATAFIDEQARREVPFLLVVGWIQAHTALHTSPEFTGLSAHGRYGDNVEEMDWSVGQVLSALERNNLRDDTLVYFSSDNGAHNEELGPNGERWGGSNGIYKGGKAMGGMEGGVRVPGVVRFPGHAPSGSVLQQPISQMDLFPTIADLMGATLPTDRTLDGVDVLSLLEGDTAAPPHEFLFHYCGVSLQAVRYAPNDGTNHVYKVHFATPDWIPGTETCLFICGCYGNSVAWHDPPIVYNLAVDPSEREPLVSTHPRYAEVLEKVAAAVEVHKSGVEPVENQMAPLKLVPLPSLQPCCGPGRFPDCQCSEPPFGG